MTCPPADMCFEPVALTGLGQGGVGGHVNSSSPCRRGARVNRSKPSAASLLIGWLG